VLTGWNIVEHPIIYIAFQLELAKKILLSSANKAAQTLKKASCNIEPGGRVKKSAYSKNPPAAEEVNFLAAFPMESLRSSRLNPKSTKASFKRRFLTLPKNHICNLHSATCLLISITTNTDLDKSR
jgi:hypothetical protein